jgi:hypothetical protein
MMEVGQQVRLKRLRDRVPQDVAAKLGAVGTVRDFKMVDGSGIGYLVEFADRFATWVFADEVEAA